MAIIIEGPDASGKTTLARILHKQFGFQHITNGGAPKTEADIIAYCERQVAYCDNRNCVIDRITPISHPVYHAEYRNHEALQHYLDTILKHPDTLVIYCRPPVEALMRPEKHEWKDYDTEEHKQKVLNNLMVFILEYDRVFKEIPHLSYDYTSYEHDYTVELLAMLAASAKQDSYLKQLKALSSKIC